jgi:predicted  nucleic acid-binding Zn-ribbon protein
MQKAAQTLITTNQWCRKCGSFIEKGRPKQTRNCVKCGKRRAFFWKKENSIVAAQHGNPEATASWRKNRDWAAYIRNYREKNIERCREQTRRAVRLWRERQKEKGQKLQASEATALLSKLPTVPFLIGFVRVFTAVGLAAPQSTDSSKLATELGSYPEILIKATEVVSLALTCWLIVFGHLKFLYGKGSNKKFTRPKRQKNRRSKRCYCMRDKVTTGK